MNRRVAICLAVLISCGPTTTWSAELEAISEKTLADRKARSWKYDELQVDGAPSLQGRSFEKGRQLFKIAKCTACHRMNGDGNEFGPDLATLAHQWTPSKILRHTLEPSLEVNREYRTHLFELESGEVVSGLITAVGLNSVNVVKDPLAGSQPRTIRTETVQQRRISRQSIMPTGLLDKLTQSEILDLVAYVYSGGNDRHAIYVDASTDNETEGKT